MLPNRFLCVCVFRWEKKTLLVNCAESGFHYFDNKNCQIDLRGSVWYAWQIQTRLQAIACDRNHLKLERFSHNFVFYFARSPCRLWYAQSFFIGSTANGSGFRSKIMEMPLWRTGKTAHPDEEQKNPHFSWFIIFCHHFCSNRTKM